MAAGELSPRALRRQHLRTLLVLRAKLTIRMFAAEQGRLFVVFMLLVAVLPFMLGIGAATAVGYLNAPEPWPGRLLAIVLVLLWLAWMIIPLVAFSMNEGMDITRLLTYPLSRLELIVSMLLGTLFDIPTYIMLPLFVAIVIGWVASPAVLILPVALLIAYMHMVFSSQILLTVLGSIIASRRFRDILIVLGALLGSSCYLLQRVFQEMAGRFVDAEALAAFDLIALLRWFPGGSQAQAIIGAANGDWPTALIWLAYGLIMAIVLAWVWWQLSVRLVTGNGFALRGLPQRRPRQQAQAEKARATRAPQWLPADLHQLILKEFRLVWRTPQRRVGLLQGFLLPVIFIGYSLLGSGLPDSFPPWLGFIPPIFGIFVAWIVGQNALGVEEKGLPLIAITPLPRQRFWLAKGLANFPMVALPTFAVSLVALFLMPGWQSIVGLLVIPGLVLAAFAVTNLGSIFFPYPVRTDGKSVKNTTRGGCISGFGNGVVLPAAIAIVMLPIALFLVGAQLLQLPLLGYIGALFSLIYGAAIFYGLGVVVAGRLTLSREAHILVATRPPQTE